MTLRASVLLFATAPLLAAVGTSANYTLAVGTFDGGGGKGVTANYEIDFSMGPGESGASLNDRLRTGFAGGLMDAVALEIDRSAAPWSFNELTTRQLAAHLVFDDDTLLALAAAESDDCYQALKLARRIIRHEDAVLGRANEPASLVVAGAA